MYCLLLRTCCGRPGQRGSQLTSLSYSGLCREAGFFFKVVEFWVCNVLASRAKWCLLGLLYTWRGSPRTQGGELAPAELELWSRFCAPQSWCKADVLQRSGSAIVWLWARGIVSGREKTVMRRSVWDLDGPSSHCGICEAIFALCQQEIQISSQSAHCDSRR